MTAKKPGPLSICFGFQKSGSKAKRDYCNFSIPDLASGALTIAFGIL
jgi:hypothetical protein